MRTQTFIAVAAAVLAACGPTVGPAGPQGPEGPQGPAGQTASVIDTVPYLTLPGQATTRSR